MVAAAAPGSGAVTVAAVAPDWLASYWERGWAVARRVFQPHELAIWTAEADRLQAELEGGPGRRGRVLNGVERSDRLDPVIDLSPVFARIATHARILDLVQRLHCASPQLFKDKYIAKPPGAAGYAAHQDLVYWPGFDIDPDRLVTVVVFLDHADGKNGAIECSPGHHRSVLTEPGSVADPDEASISPFETVAVDPGDMLLLHSLTPHRSDSNQSPMMRRTLLFTYAFGEEPGLYERYQRERAT
jgi:ectoine hydroxylase-related dioxygenase (phytanoyl-CoA dioxygenase family)